MTALVAPCLTALVLVALVAVSGELVDHQRARSAADAAALAGVTGGRRAALAVAAANGADLVEWEARTVSSRLGTGTEVVVVVAVGDRRSRARATNAP